MSFLRKLTTLPLISCLSLMTWMDGSIVHLLSRLQKNEKVPEKMSLNLPKLKKATPNIKLPKLKKVGQSETPKMKLPKLKKV